MAALCRTIFTKIFFLPFLGPITQIRQSAVLFTIKEQNTYYSVNPLHLNMAGSQQGGESHDKILEVVFFYCRIGRLVYLHLDTPPSKTLGCSETGTTNGAEPSVSQ